MGFAAIQHRLHEGRPLVLDSDTGAAFRARGVQVGVPGALGQLLRQSPTRVLAHYQAEVRSRVDVVSALTADTTPRSLSEVGMEHRAAVLTGLAVELAFEAADESPKPIAVAGVLGSDMVAPIAPDRYHGELCEHAERLAVAGCELIVARGQGSRLALMSAVVAAARTELPTWAVVECLATGELVAGGSPRELIESLAEAGATAILFEVASIDHGVDLLTHHSLAGLDGCVPGVLVASSAESVRGFPDEDSTPRQWARRALDLDAHGARVVGGGAGTTEAHTAALAFELGLLHPSLPVPNS